MELRPCPFCGGEVLGLDITGECWLSIATHVRLRGHTQQAGLHQ